MERHDFAFPFRIDGASRQAQQSPYAAHVAQMIRQVLLTDPGERADLPEFGCGLRQLIFAPNSDALRASTKVLVLQGLNQWLSDQITVLDVTVSTSDDASQLLVEVHYVLIETQTNETLSVPVI
ncbi:MAG TPA: GPW/gp25 family protein [Bryobacteraceae bacterium]|nr:GPW/gp25 family protein [Bryobacteraceae bacterium]